MWTLVLIKNFVLLSNQILIVKGKEKNNIASLVVTELCKEWYARIYLN